jgi:hypothetical protein
MSRSIDSPAKRYGWDAWYTIEMLNLNSWTPTSYRYPHAFGFTRLKARAKGMRLVHAFNKHYPGCYRLVHCEVSFQEGDLS